MKVPGISGGWILIYLSNATKRTRTPKGGKNAYRGQERLSTGKVALTNSNVCPRRGYRYTPPKEKNTFFPVRSSPSAPGAEGPNDPNDLDASDRSRADLGDGSKERRTCVRFSETDRSTCRGVRGLVSLSDTSSIVTVYLLGLLTNVKQIARFGVQG